MFGTELPLSPGDAMLCTPPLIDDLPIVTQTNYVVLGAMWLLYIRLTFLFFLLLAALVCRVSFDTVS